MPHGSIVVTIPAPSEKVFALLHDYDRRLEWDTLLQAAYLTDSWKTAQLHATAICKGRWFLGGFALKTEYVSFRPPSGAAVRMVNKPPFFNSFAATIRHHDLPNGISQVEYIYTFTSRPRLLQWVLHPIMAVIFQYETRKRLQSLAAFFAREQVAHQSVPLLR